MNRYHYVYRIITHDDFNSLEAKGYNMRGWFLRNVDKLTKLYEWTEKHGNNFYGWLLPKGMRMPRLAAPITSPITSPKPSNKTTEVTTDRAIPLEPSMMAPLTTKKTNKSIAANALRGMLS